MLIGPVLILVLLSAGALDRPARLECEQRLAALGYWTGEVDGRWDPGTADALLAFRKVEGRPLQGPASAADLQALRSATRPLPLEGGPAHLEVDLDRQVLFVVGEGGAVERVLPVSTGNGCTFTEGGRTRRAVTPPGRYRVERKLKGWRRSPLGRLYSPMYIHGGIAIHGSKEVPSHPASHGCIRVPMFAADPLSDATPLGTPVLVHGCCSGAGAKHGQKGENLALGFAVLPTLPAPGQLEKETLDGVRNFTVVDASVGCAGATEPRAMAALKARGYKAIVNLRQATEAGAAIDESRAAAGAAGLTFIHLPFNGAQPDMAVADAFIKAVTDPANQPVFVNCGSANRVGALWLAKRLLVDRWERAKAIEEAKAIGLSSEALLKFALDYVAARKQR